MTDPGAALLESSRRAWAEAQQAAEVLRHDLTIAGVRVRLELAGDRLCEAVLPALELHPRTHHDRADVHLRAYDSAGTGVPMPALPTREQQRLVEWHDDDGTKVVWAWHPHVGISMLADPGPRGVGHLAAVDDATTLPWWEHGAPLRQLLLWAMRDRQRYFVHAAAVGRPEGAVLLAGPGGIGKSSTAVSCVLGGLGYLGDDYCVLTMHEGPRVHAVYGTAKLRPDQLALVDAVDGLDRQVLLRPSADDSKVILLPVRWAPELVVQQAPIAAVMVPSQGGVPGIEPLSPAAALRHLAPTSLLQLAGPGTDDFRALAELVRTVPC
ncbi:MAG: hypothetical protein ACSLFP_12505, partial [Acidimicrobiales bacterium]